MASRHLTICKTHAHVSRRPVSRTCTRSIALRHQFSITGANMPYLLNDVGQDLFFVGGQGNTFQRAALSASGSGHTQPQLR